jgi:hypothetical protein
METDMYRPQRTRPRRTSTRTIIDAVIIFAGVLLLAGGYYGGSEIILAIGLVVISAGIMIEIASTILATATASSHSRRHR